MLIGYLMAAAETFLATYVTGVFRLSACGIGPTEMRILLCIGSLCLLYKPVVHLGGWGSFRLFDIGGMTALAGFALVLASSVIRNVRLLRCISLAFMDVKYENGANQPMSYTIFQ